MVTKLLNEINVVTIVTIVTIDFQKVYTRGRGMSDEYRWAVPPGAIGFGKTSGDNGDVVTALNFSVLFPDQW